MLVIISDLHLTDGSSGQTIREGAFKIFRQRLRDMAYDASWRATGGNHAPRYKPIKEMDLILLGDILDVIRSNQWFTNTVRPWDVSDPAKRGELATKVAQINERILRQNKASLDILKNLVKGGDRADRITLPPATEDGDVDRSIDWRPGAEGRDPVKVNIHYMVGNHDWLYHLPGEEFAGIRKTVRRALGLANTAALPFPHDPEESRDIKDALDEHRVFARHGDIFDPFNYVDHEGRDASSLGDAIVIELLNRFPQEVEKERSIPKDVKEGIRELDNVRPLTLIPVWIDGLLRRSSANKQQQKLIKKIWDELVDAFLEVPFVREKDSPWHWWDSVDKLETALKFSKGISLSTASSAIRLFGGGVGSSGDSYCENAMTEVDFKNQSAHYIVYGHTHHHEVMPLDVVQPRGKREISQIYINTGTWRRVHRLALRSSKDEEFIDWNVMTYVAFFKDDERVGRPFEVWSGALGV